jgi:DNA polymerase-3 subunit delta
MLYVLYGPDQFRVREELRAIRERLDRDGNLAHNTVRLEGRGLTPGDLRAACHAASFFAEDRLVIVEGLQARLSGSRRRTSSGRRSSSRGAPAESDLERFLDVLTQLPPTTTAVLIDEQPATAFMDGVKDMAEIRRFDILRPAEVRAWATDRARAQGARFAPAALERLVSLIDGYHLGELAQEIDKLATYAAGRSVEVRDVDELVSGAVQFQTWDLTDAVIQGRGDRALSVLRAMDARDFPRQLLIFMITRQFRQVMLAKALAGEGLHQNEIGARLGLSGYPLQKAVEQAARYAPDRLDAAYRRLHETDVHVKTGVLDVDTALELLIVDIAELAQTPRLRPARAR